MTLEDLAKIALSEEALAKGAEGKAFVIVLNKCEGERIGKAKKLREMLNAQGTAVVLTAYGRPLPGEEEAYGRLLG